MCVLTCNDGHMDLDWVSSWPFAGVPTSILGLDLWYNQRTILRHSPGRCLYGSATSLPMFDQHHWGISWSSERPFGAVTLLLIVWRISTRQNLLTSISDHDISLLLPGPCCWRKIRLMTRQQFVVKLLRHIHPYLWGKAAGSEMKTFESTWTRPLFRSVCPRFLSQHQHLVPKVTRGHLVSCRGVLCRCLIVIIRFLNLVKVQLNFSFQL